MKCIKIKEMRHSMKRFDLIIIIVLIVLVLVSFQFIKAYQNKDYSEKYVQISVDGKKVKEIPLNDNETFTVKTEFGTNVIKVENGKVHVHEADCPDKICIKDGYIDKPGEILVCLPNKVVVEIIGQNERDLDEISY